MLSVGTSVAGFRVDSVADVADVGGRLWRMTYVQNGAELIWLERRDDIKTFVISFKTAPYDDTGVAHIIEHSVLCGSKKYPIKDPFREMRKNSVSVFMNAMTGNERTYYPFSTRNDKDFLNLMDVYLDAVFHPRSVETPFAFQQEGFHFSIDEEAQRLTCNGVVYNEMKGAYADIGGRCVREVLKGLYPRSSFGRDAGGSPDEINALGYEQYKDFYKRHYHPSNARVFIDGVVEIEIVLGRIASYLREYERRADFGGQCPVDSVESFHRASYDPHSCSDRGIVADGWSVANRNAGSDSLICDIVSQYLTGTNESPLKAALLKEGLCKNVSLFAYDRQHIPVFLIGRDVPSESVQLYHEVCHSVLKNVARKGFEVRRLSALLEKREFLLREINTQRPKGLIYFSRLIGPWQRGEDPVEGLNLTGKLAALSQGVENGLYETWLRDCILGNRHHCEVFFAPEKDYSDKIVQQERERLEARLSLMSEEEKKRIHAEGEELKNWQETPGASCDFSCLPALSVDDVFAKGCRIDGAIQSSGKETFVRVKTTCEGIAYVFFYFPLNNLSEAFFRLAPLYAGLLGKLPTKRHSLEELQTLMYETAGRLTFSTTTCEKGAYLRVSLSVLESRIAAGLDVVCEILTETQFDDTDRIGRVLLQRKLAAEAAVSSRGHRFAVRYSSREFARRWAERETLFGIEQLRVLGSIAADGNPCGTLRRLSEDLLCRDGLIISSTDNVPIRALDSCVSLFGAGVQNGVVTSRELNVKTFKCFRIASDTGFSGVTALLPSGVPYDGSMLVAARMLSLGPLHEMIREKNGAYGAGFKISRYGIIEAHTYRDPNPQKSIETMIHAGDLLRTQLCEFGILQQYVVSTVASLDPYRSDAVNAERFVLLYLNNRSVEDEDRVREEVLGTVKEDVQMAADVIESAFKNASACIVGGERQCQGFSADDVDFVIRRR